MFRDENWASNAVCRYTSTLPFSSIWGSKSTSSLPTDAIHFLEMGRWPSRSSSSSVAVASMTLVTWWMILDGVEPLDRMSSRSASDVK